MFNAALILLVYGLLILIGGIIGHVQAKSTPSLVMGLLFGSLLIGSAIGLFKRKKAAAWIALTLVLLLDAFFTYRFLHTQRFMPSGLLMLISLATLVTLIIQLRKKK
ncbi:MAG: TMEM14 family protein [Chlamydiales bacterium]